LQLGKLYDGVGLRLTEKDKNDWILALHLLIQAALTRSSSCDSCVWPFTWGFWVVGSGF
jgi:hypothetical protein